MRSLLLLLMASTVLPLLCHADTITVDGRRQTNLYVRETETRYYLCSPRDGSVTSVSRSEGRVSGFTRSADSEELRQQWLARRAPHLTEGAQSVEAATPAPMPPPTRTAPVPVLSNETQPAPPGMADESGIPNLVIKGNTKPDPAREDAKLHFVLQERARIAYLRAEQQRAWEEEQRRLEQEAYDQYMRDLQVQEQELRVDRLADENEYRERLRVPTFGYIVDSPWRRVRNPHHERDNFRDRIIDRTRDRDAEEEGASTGRGNRTESPSSTPSPRQRRRTSQEPQESDSATVQSP